MVVILGLKTLSTDNAEDNPYIMLLLNILFYIIVDGNKIICKYIIMKI